MGWNADHTEYFDEFHDDEPQRSRLTGIMIGAAMGIITLVLIAALLVTTIGHFPWATASFPPPYCPLATALCTAESSGAIVFRTAPTWCTGRASRTVSRGILRCKFPVLTG